MIYRLSFVFSAVLLSACSSPTAPERANTLPVASTALIPAPVAVTPEPVAPAPPPSPVAAGCSDRMGSSWWWEKPTGVYYFNGCDKPLNYVLAHFRINTATWSTDQTLLSMTEELLHPGTYGRQHIMGVTDCSQRDLYVGITIDDINSGRVTIHPRDEGKPNFVSALEGWYRYARRGVCAPVRAPGPASASVPVSAPVPAPDGRLSGSHRPSDTDRWQQRSRADGVLHQAGLHERRSLAGQSKRRHSRSVPAPGVQGWRERILQRRRALLPRRRRLRHLAGGRPVGTAAARGVE